MKNNLFNSPVKKNEKKNIAGKFFLKMMWILKNKTIIKKNEEAILCE